MAGCQDVSTTRTFVRVRCHRKCKGLLALIGIAVFLNNHHHVNHFGTC